MGRSMEKSREGLCELIEKVNILYNGFSISKEIILDVEKRFLTEAFDEDTHKTLFVQHTGSDLYDAVAMAVVTMAIILLDNSKAVDVVNEIKEGDLVTYHSKRWIYSGMAFLYGMDRYVLKDDKGCTTYLLEDSMCDVLPYNGKSKNLDGKGIGKSKSKRTEFLEEVAGLKRNEIPAIPAQSVVVFIDNHRFDELLNGISISYGAKEYYLLDLVTASFFTDNNELKKRGNANNNEAMLKATLSIDKAREMVKAKHGNFIMGLLVLDDRSYQKYGLDLEELLYRKKLPFSILLTKLSMDRWIRAQLENQDDIMVLPCTSEYLKSLDSNRESNFLADNLALTAFREEIQNAKWGESRLHFVDSTFTWGDIKRIKENIAFVIGNCLEDPMAVEFSRWAYSMIKLFNNAVFSFEEYENLSSNYAEMRDFSMPSKQIEEYKSSIDKFPLAVRRQSQIILDYIELKYKEHMESNSKREALREIFKDLELTNMLVIVPNVRYKPFVERFYPKTWKAVLKNKYVIATESQAKKMDISQFSDIYYLSLMNVSKYNPFDNVFFTSVDILVYDSQMRLYKSLYREFVDYKKMLNKRAYEVTDEILKYSDNSEGYLTEDFEDETEVLDVSEVVELDNEIHQSFMRMFLQSERFKSQRDYSDNLRGGVRFLEAYKYANFVTGENIIFTKGYTAYVVDADKQSVVERAVDELKEGDQLIFTINDDNTKDIVDELLVGVAEKNPEVERYYQLVNSWKEACRNYRYDNNLKYTQLSKMFATKGYKAQPQVIRSWLDEQSHIVGPKQDETFMYIQQVFGESVLPENYMDYAVATKYIRSARVKILKLIEKAVISENIEFDDNSHIFDGLNERIQETAIIKQIEHIEAIEPFNIAGYRANKPIEN